MLKYNTPAEQDELFRKHKKLTRGYGSDRATFPKMKVAILSGVTVHPLKDILETLILDGGFQPEFFEGDYNAFAFEARFSEELIQFEPEFVYLHTTIDNVVGKPSIASSESEATALVENFVEEIQSATTALIRRTNASVVINTLEFPNFRMNGNFEAVASGGMVRFISDVNDRLCQIARNNSRVLINDMNYLAAKVGLENWRNDQSYAAFKQPLTRRAVVETARSVSALVLAAKGKSGKCLVLDLDNTMWGGIIGDDGVDGVEIGPDTPKGEGYHAFQSAIKPLLDRGIAFGVCSKNEEATGLAGLNRTEMVIKEADFHAIRINWNQKSENLKALKQIFNVGYDAMVFIDDSPFEREEVRFTLPDVKVPDVEPNPWSYIQALSNSYAFETVVLTDEDLKRGESFRSMATLASKVDEGGDVSDFLKSLEMEAAICTVSEATQTRVYQLINKTNQFNLTTLRATEAEVTQHLGAETMLTASLKDRNSDYGLVSVLWGEVVGDTFTLRNWVMSCRVFNRRLEEYFFGDLCRRLAQNGVSRITAEYVPSKKNMPVEGLLPRLGFSEIEKEEGRTTFEFDISGGDVGMDAETRELYK